MNTNNFDLNLLRVFAAIDAERNVSRAAAKIGLSQPAMSNSLARLRKACNDALFVRTPSGMEPTALALEMSGNVHDALTRLERVLGGPGDFDPQRVQRRFRLLMSDAGQMIVLPKLMQALAKDAPGVAIETVQLPRERFLEALQNGAADLAISHLTTLRAGIYQEALFDDTYCCVAALKHSYLREKITMQQFLKAKHVVISSGNAEVHIDRLLGKKKLTRDIGLTVSQYHVALEVVRGTSLVATVPRLSVGLLPALQVLELPFHVPKAQIRQLWHRRVHNDPANQWLRNFMKATIGQQG